MLLKPYTWNGHSDQKIYLGDVLSLFEVLPATLGATNITVTGAILGQSIVQLSNGGASVATIDSAANIVAALSQNLGNVGIDNGTSWRVKFIQSTAFASTLTATANTGITVTSGIINASSVKEFLVQITNGTPAQTFTCMTTNASAVITGLSLAQTSLLSPGMVVTNAVNGLQADTIISVQSGVGVTMSGNANATSVLPGVAVTFSPAIVITGLGQGLL